MKLTKKLAAGSSLLAVAAAPAAAETPKTRLAASTSYCLHGQMADQSTTRAGSVAMNTWPLGTRIRLVDRAFMGRREFVVRDRIGFGSQLDFWAPACSLSMWWGRRTVRYRVLGGAT
jgi:hypothetical protein